MVLSDKEIKDLLESKELIIETPDLYIGPSSVDMHLDNKAQIFVKGELKQVIRIDERNSDNFKEYNGWNELIIYPGEFYILSTVERFKLPNYIVGFVQGRSSIARAGISIHMAGFVDSGFEGNITLEVTNFTNTPILIPKNSRIGQIVFARMLIPSEIPYGDKKDSKYQGQMGPTITRIYKDYSHEK